VVALEKHKIKKIRRMEYEKVIFCILLNAQLEVKQTHSILICMFWFQNCSVDSTEVCYSEPIHFV
jgi:hypothetical protein